MIDIKTIPIIELLKDRLESQEDIANCKKALRIGYTIYGEDGSSVKGWLEINEKIIAKIDAEIERRANETTS